jgi:predicted dehydrogenase
MDPLRLAIVGCGGMGRRHLAGLAELERCVGHLVELVAVCDLNETNASELADEADGLLGYRPVVFGSIDTMVAGMDGLEAADCTTDSGSHHIVAAALLDAGLHTMVEKPLALTIQGCNRIIEAAERSGKLLSVAENFRRDPMNRLVKALLDASAIGAPQSILETSIHGRDHILITPWRHMKLSGTITLDAGVHNADILRYYFGDVISAFGQTRIFEPVRVRQNTAGPGGYYEKWADSMPERIEPTGEDAVFGLLTFANGAIGQFVDNHAGHGEAIVERRVFGTRGSITPPGDRNGKPVRVVLDDGTDVTGEAVLVLVPDWQLDSDAAALFGSNRPARYDYDFVTTDRKLLALEYAELARCIRTGTRPEVDGYTGRAAVALINALFESQVAGRPVTIAEVESGAVDAYQREIDEHYGLR